MSDCTCGCCEGVRDVTPLSTINRPGLPALNYRVGRYADFFESMKARLANFSMTVKDGADAQTVKPLAALKTRDPGDPSIALLDAWSVVADVLTFYSERIANEGFLATATDRQSVVMLAALTGYLPQPGVASDTLLAYTLQTGAACTIPAGAAAQNVPPQNAQAQTFETSSDLDARAEWNNLQPRQTQPQLIDPSGTNEIYLDGISTQLQANDMLLLVKGTSDPVPRWVDSVDVDQPNMRTHVKLRVPDKIDGDVVRKEFFRLRDFYTKELARWRIPDTLGALAHEAFQDHAPTSFSEDPAIYVPKVIDALETNLREKLIRRATPGSTTVPRRSPKPTFFIWYDDMIAALREFQRRFSKSFTVPQQPKPTPAPVPNLEKLLPKLSLAPSSLQATKATLPHDFQTNFSETSDVIPRALLAMGPELDRQLYKALAQTGEAPQDVKVYAMRVRAPLFGHNAPKEPVIIHRGPGHDQETSILPRKFDREPQPSNAEGPGWVFLDTVYDKLKPDSPVVLVSTFDSQPHVFTAQDVSTVSRADYGLTAKVTKITLPLDKPLDDYWFPWRAGRRASNFSFIRQTVVYAQPDELDLADAPVTSDFPENQTSTTIELGALYDGLTPGKIIVISGPRTDSDLAGAIGTETAMISQVDQKTVPTLPGDKTHTFLTLANPLAFSYVRNKVTIYGNVVAATQGQSQQEVLGSGDGQQAFQTFQLKQSPLTYVSSSNAKGAQDTLSVTVSGVEWTQIPSFSQAGPTDHAYVFGTTAQGQITVTFGDGIHGVRLPSGTSNIAAKYRVGLGQSGNVDAQTITTLASRPLGVSGVTNPVPASGGADPAPITAIRRNAAVGLASLDHLVSLSDYEDFARQHGGVAKASATWLALGGQQIIHVTVAAQDDAPLSPTSLANLRAALLQYGDPHLNVRVAARRLKALLVQAQIFVQTGYDWNAVQPAIVDALMSAFCFNNRDFGESLFLSQVVSVIQSVPGVDWARMQALQGISETMLRTPSEMSAISKGLPKGQPENEIAARLARRNRTGGIDPAQIVHALPDVPELILLQQGTP